jgi:hypothetical protein
MIDFCGCPLYRMFSSGATVFAVLNLANTYRYSVYLRESENEEVCAGPHYNVLCGGIIRRHYGREPT